MQEGEDVGIVRIAWRSWGTADYCANAASLPAFFEESDRRSCIICGCLDDERCVISGSYKQAGGHLPLQTGMSGLRRIGQEVLENRIRLSLLRETTTQPCGPWTPANFSVG